MSLLERISEDRVRRLVLDRPEKRNALCVPLCRELLAALEQADNEPSVHAIVLSANGPSFCAGMDLAEVAQGDTAEISDLHERLFTIGSRLSKPVIAAVQGASLGGGLGVVANCHIVVSAPDATFGLTEIRLALWPFLVYRAVEAALGERRTLEMALTGRITNAGEMRELGLVHELAADPLARAREIAGQIADLSPAAVQNGLRFVHESRGKDWQTAGRIARKFRDLVFVSPEFRSALTAFQPKNKAK